MYQRHTDMTDTRATSLPVSDAKRVALSGFVESNSHADDSEDNDYTLDGTTAPELCNTVLTDEQILRLASAMDRRLATGERVPLRSICIENVKLGENGIKIFVDAARAQGQTQLEQIVMNNVGMTVRGASSLADLIAMNPLLTEVHVSNNDIRDMGAHSIIDAFIYATRLGEPARRAQDGLDVTYVFDFSDNWIGHLGMSSIARLVRNTGHRLAALYVSGNFSPDMNDIVAIANEIRNHCVTTNAASGEELAFLDCARFAGMRLTKQCAEALIDAIAPILRCSVLDLRGNELLFAHRRELIARWENIRRQRGATDSNFAQEDGVLIGPVDTASSQE